MVNGLEPSTDPIRVETLVAPFQIRGIAVTLTIAPYDGDGTPLDYDSEMAQHLRSLIRENRTDLEIGLHVETLGSEDPYFQLREISTAQALFSKAVNEYERYKSKAVVTAYTLTTTSPLLQVQDGASMRAAGIRSIVRLPAGGKNKGDLHADAGGYWVAENGLVNIIGLPSSSARSNPKRVPDPRSIASGVKKLTAASNPIVIDLPYATLANISNGDLAKYATDLADALVQQIESDEVRSIIPVDLHRDSVPDRHRYVAIRVDDLRIDSNTDPLQMAFSENLIGQGYPVTEAIIPGPTGQVVTEDKDVLAYLQRMRKFPRYDVATHGWAHTSSELAGNTVEKNLLLVRDGVFELASATGSVPVSYIPPNNAFDENALVALSAVGTSIISAEKGDFRWFSGLDERGLLHASNTIMFEKSWEGDYPYHDTQTVLDMIGDRNDAVFSIHVNTANTPQKQRQIQDVLSALSQSKATTLVNFGEYRKAVLPPLESYDRIRSARANVSISDWRPRRLGDRDRDQLQKDAELAWRYFDWGTATYNGIAPGTSWMEGDQQQGYPFATMWDVASTIMATVSAKRLGLIDAASMEERCSRIVEFLGEQNFHYAGVNLPPAERRLTKQAGERQGFDSADTGRLLIALKVLDIETSGSLPIDKLVGRWGFHKILVNGEMHLVSARGRRSSVHANSYANYASKGYQLWGFETAPVFGERNPLDNMDDAITELGEIAARGRIGTEPHLTEEIELGGSAHGRFTADILLDAQMRRYAETGVLTAVSEGPVDFAPYFTYQGYQVTPAGGDFVVDAPTSKQAYQAARRAEGLRMVSSKAAYLWYACRPGTYSQKLIDHIRASGTLPGIGFSSGVGEISQSAIRIADVNTNGIILESISYLLSEETPFLGSNPTSGI